MKKYKRIILLAATTALGPALCWIGGMNERSPTLAITTACTFVLGLALAMMPGAYPWEDE